MQCYFKNYLTTFQNQFSYSIPDLGNETLLRLLSTNSNNVKRAEAQTHENIPPRLKNHAQAFRTAGKKFQVIAEQTTDILVPYGEGNDLISGLKALTRLKSDVLSLKPGYYSSEQGVCADGMISMEECFL